MTEEQLREWIINLYVDQIIYDAENSTSYREEIRQLVEEREDARGINDQGFTELYNRWCDLTK